MTRKFKDFDLFAQGLRSNGMTAVIRAWGDEKRKEIFKAYWTNVTSNLEIVTTKLKK